MSIESFKVKTMWHCDACDKTIQRSSKSAHLKTKNHQKKTTNKECDLCCHSSIEFKHCTQCVNSWCVDCHQKIDQCPFCRKRIVGSQPRPVQWELGTEFFPEPDYYLTMEDVIALERHLNWLNSFFA
jgi:hypothetical protein